MRDTQRETILFEIAMTIGNTLVLEKMCKESLEAFIKKLNASSGVIFEINSQNDSLEEGVIASIPRRLKNLDVYNDLKEEFSTNPAPYQTLFLNNSHFYLFNLNTQGYLGLQRAHPFDELILKSLYKLMQKLSTSMQACKDNAKLEVSLEAAQASEKSKSEFLANMSHEIRTPMNAILGMTQLALRGELNPRARNYVEKSNIAATNLLRILNDILDFSKMDAGKMELSNSHFQLKNVIANTRQLISVAIKDKNIKTKIILDKDVPKAYYADSIRLGQVLTNLTSNAVKFSKSEGTITLNISLLKEDSKYAYIQFSVSDEGIGISQENQQKLFQSFSQAESSTQRRFGGTGLGLAISKKIVDLMDGEIWVESEIDEGSTFSFYIKMQKSNKNAILENNNDTQKAIQLAVEKLNGTNVLLVEDNELNQELAVDLLTNSGLNVSVANNGKEAIEVMETQEFDIVLMDVQMPVMDGYEATKILRKEERFKNIPIIALSANVMQDDVEKVKLFGMNDHIGKPINVTTLLTTMAKWMD